MSSSQGSSTTARPSLNSKRRRRSAPPPARLSWPGDSLYQPTAAAVSHSQPAAAPTAPTNTAASRKSGNKNKHSNKSKRQRTLLSALNNASSTTNQDSSNNNGDNDNGTTTNASSLMWVDRYAPTSRQQLCVAPKKVQEVATWLEQEKTHEQLLILVGRPGIGKSTMMRVLADCLGLEVLEWSDSYSAYSNQLESLSPLSSFAQFLQQSGVGFTSLELQAASSSFSTLAASLSSSPPKDESQQQRKRHNNTNNRLILLEELPNLANPESQERFRDLLTTHVQQSLVKTVWIYSDGTEGNHKPADLERHVRPEVLYKHSKILQINPVTKPQIKKCLERIGKAQNFRVSKDFCERMHVQSGGDIRSCINSLQFDQAANSNSNNKSLSAINKKGKKNKKAAVPDATSSEHSRDTQWTAFHALGKLLYAKREPIQATTAATINTHTVKGERPPLTFDPEQVLEHCDLDLGHALTYLGFHCVDFFTDVEELSTALDLYSDASYLLEQTTNYNYQRRRGTNSHQNNSNMVSCPIFPEGYVSSLTGRAIAHANRHPAPSRFRSLQAPKVLEVRRKRNDNAHQLERLQQRLSMLSMAEQSSTITASASLPSFVMDQLPFLRTIIPHDVNSSLDQLHSSGSEHTDRFLEQQQKEEEAAEALLEQEQKEILQADDIDEFDSDNDEDESNIVEARQKLQQPLPIQSSLADRGGLSQSNPTQANPQAKATNNGNNPSMKGMDSHCQPTASKAARPFKPVIKVVNPYRKTTASANCFSQTSSASGAAGPSTQHIQPPEQRPSLNNPYSNKKKAVPNPIVSKPKSEPKHKEPCPPQLPDEDSPRTVGNVVLMDV